MGWAGFEPATFAVSGRRPNQASPMPCSILDDQPRDWRSFYSVSSFPDRQKRSDCISGATTNLIPTVDCEAAYENTDSKTPLSGFALDGIYRNIGTDCSRSADDKRADRSSIIRSGRLRHFDGDDNKQ